MNRIPGVYSPIPMGAFYTVAKLPVDDSDKFCAWCLSDFEYEGQTVFMAPASGFYTTPGSGINRGSYCLRIEERRFNPCTFCLAEGFGSVSGKNGINLSIKYQVLSIYTNCLYHFS